uniref:Putative LOC100571282 [Acyrthosiphon pisum] n=1 Tax=Lepeophtheirus salmonis TaxID=72036 RepID=A0A0K2V332_LEPSM
MNVTEDGFYKLGTTGGILKQLYAGYNSLYTKKKKSGEN